MIKLTANQFFRLVKGKRVALVCPSQCVVDSKQGDYIESFDLIVRINRQHPVNPKLVDDIGCRTDILYNSNLGDASDNLLESLEAGHLNTLKCICYPEESKLTKVFEETAQDFPTTHFPWPQQLTVEMMQQARDWRIACPNQQHDFFVGHTGTIALYHLLRNDPAELYITGMTWYREPYYKGYKEKGHKPSIEEKNQVFDKWKKGETPRKLHNIDMDAEIEFFKRLKAECPLRNDSVMQQILLESGDLS